MLLASLLAGCVTAPEPVPVLQGPDYFDDQTQPDVVLGYFTDPKHLGIATCPDSGDPDVSIDCFGPTPMVTLVVQDVIFGRVESARLEVSVYDVEDPRRFPMGPRQRVLAYPERWGGLGTYAWHRVFETRSGWAIPVAAEGDWPWLPCSAERFLKVEVLDVTRPLPIRPLSQYDAGELAEIRANANVTIRGGMVYSRAGVLLSEIYALRERIPRLEPEDMFEVDACLRK